MCIVALCMYVHIRICHVVRSFVYVCGMCILLFMVRSNLLLWLNCKCILGIHTYVHTYVHVCVVVMYKSTSVHSCVFVVLMHVHTYMCVVFVYVCTVSTYVHVYILYV